MRTRSGTAEGSEGRKVERALADLQRAETAMLRHVMAGLEQAQTALEAASAGPGRAVDAAAAERRMVAARRQAAWWESAIDSADF